MRRRQGQGEGAHAAHGEARHVDAVPVHGVTFADLIQQGQEDVRIPDLPLGALGRDHDEGKIPGPLLQELRQAVPLHEAQVASPLAGAVQEENQGPAALRVIAVPLRQKEQVVSPDPFLDNPFKRALLHATHPFPV